MRIKTLALANRSVMASLTRNHAGAGLVPSAMAAEYTADTDHPMLQETHAAEVPSAGRLRQRGGPANAQRSSRRNENNSERRCLRFSISARSRPAPSMLKVMPLPP